MYIYILMYHYYYCNYIICFSNYKESHSLYIEDLINIKKTEKNNKGEIPIDIFQLAQESNCFMSGSSVTEIKMWFMSNMVEFIRDFLITHFAWPR